MRSRELLTRPWFMTLKQSSASLKRTVCTALTSE